MEDEISLSSKVSKQFWGSFAKVIDKLCFQIKQLSRKEEKIKLACLNGSSKVSLEAFLAEFINILKMFSNNSTCPFSMSVINTLSYGVDVFVAMHVSRCIPNPGVSLFGRPTLMKISELSSISLGVLRSLSACLNWFVSYCRISIFKCPNRFSYTLTCCLTGWYEDMVISVLG